ncbi:MAG: hypothetical protein V3T72_20005 [Thermoanaerobaculia bacterium]
MQTTPESSAATSSDRARALAAARRFHWAGTAAGERQQTPPATSHPFLDAAELRSPYPLRVEPGEDGSPSCRPLAELGDATPEDGDPAVAADGRLVTAGESAAIELFAAAAEIHLGASRAEFSRTLGELAEGLRALLEIDRRRRRQGGDMVAELGQLGDRFLDPAALAETLHTEDAAPGLGEERQRRVRGALDGLAAWQEIAAEPALIVVHDGKDRCAVARELFDRSAARLAEVLRAVRVARLELAGDYDPERHDPWLEELDWQAFERRELMLLPRVLACLDGDELVAALRLADGLRRPAAKGRHHPASRLRLPRPAGFLAHPPGARRSAQRVRRSGGGASPERGGGGPCPRPRASAGGARRRPRAGAGGDRRSGRTQEVADDEASSSDHEPGNAEETTATDAKSGTGATDAA